MCTPDTGIITDAAAFCIHTASVEDRQSLIYNLQNARIESGAWDDGVMTQRPSSNTALCKKWINSVLAEASKFEPPVITCPLYVGGLYLGHVDMAQRPPAGPAED